MSDDHSYTGLPVTTLSAKIKAADGTECSDTDALIEPTVPEAQNPSAVKLNGKSLIAPIGTFIFGAVLAVSHHTLNAWADGRPVATIKLPQDWVTRIGVGFSFGFKTALGATMAFVLLQCLWLSVGREPLTIQAINTLYHIERRDQLFKTLPQALSLSPIIVTFSILTLFLPLSGVFAPGSLTVITKNYTDLTGPCTIPTGNLSTPNTTDSGTFSVEDVTFLNVNVSVWTDVAPKTRRLTTQWFVGQRIPDLPQACGPNCVYKVSVPSFVFQCTPNPSSLPDGQAGPNEIDLDLGLVPQRHVTTLWNGTTDPTSNWAFYIAWKSNGPNGTSGNASCAAVQAQYDIEVQTKGGVQSVTTNITEVTSLIPDVGSAQVVDDLNTYNVNFTMDLASLSYATLALFLGDAVLTSDPFSTSLAANTSASQASFLDAPIASQDLYVWGDVLNGIENMSHNVTAALLTLQLGTMSTDCLFDKQTVVYQYTRFALWAPYGAALCVTLISLVVAIMIMARNNTGYVTTSFSDTITLTRHLEENLSAGAKLRLRSVKGGELEYTVE